MSGSAWTVEPGFASVGIVAACDLGRDCIIDQEGTGIGKLLDRCLHREGRGLVAMAPPILAPPEASVAKLWILSDLHLETLPDPDGFRPAPPAFDVLVAAGDIQEGDPGCGFAFLRRLAGDRPVVFVMGNHEHWNGLIDEDLALAGMGSVRGRGVNSRTALAGIGVAIGPCG